MAIDHASTVNLNISSSTKLSINSSGYVTKPYHPAFSAHNGNAATAGSNIIFSSAVFNTGAHYSEITGRFTAPVAGVYYFRFHQLAAHNQSGEYRTAIYKNGGGYGGLRFITQKVVNTWWSLIAEGHVYMSVNDYVNARLETAPTALYTDLNYNSFTGHLVG